MVWLVLEKLPKNILYIYSFSFAEVLEGMYELKLLKMTFRKLSLPAELGKGNGFLEVSSSTWFYSSIIELGLDNPPRGQCYVCVHRSAIFQLF